MADLPDVDYDEQDAAEVFDEDNTNLEEQRYTGREDAEQFEDLVDVFDATAAVGDADDDEAMIGEDMDDGEIVSAASDDEDDDDLEDDDLARRDPEAFDREQDLDDGDLDDDDPDQVDEIDRLDPDEVELDYAGDLSDAAGAASSARDLESDELSDADLEELDYKEANRG